MTQEFLIKVQTDEITRFKHNPEDVLMWLQSLTGLFFEVMTEGSKPAVTVTAGDPDLPYSEVRELLEEMLPLLLDGEQCSKALEVPRPISKNCWPGKRDDTQRHPVFAF